MLILLLSLALGQERADRPGRWYPADPVVQQLQALGYAGGTEAPSAEGTHTYGEPVAGYVLYSSGHRPEARLIDRAGQVRHRWHLPFEEAFPGADEARHVGAGSWRAVAPLADGGLLAVHEGLGSVSLHRDGTRRWAQLDGSHHDIVPLDDGTAWFLTRRVSRRGEVPVLEDHLTHRGADGSLLAQHSLLAALETSPWRGWIDPDVEGIRGYLLHTNSLHRLVAPGYHPAFQPGRFLLSMRHLDALLVFDPGAGGFVWASKGAWSRQHDAQQGPSGRLWVFDNRGAGDERSRVLGLDPSQPTKVVRSWGADEGLHSAILGAVQELPGGHLLVTESMTGRCVEVDGTGQVVWEHVNPERVQQGDETLQAVIFACRWIPETSPVVHSLGL